MLNQNSINQEKQTFFAVRDSISEEQRVLDAKINNKRNNLDRGFDYEMNQQYLEDIKDLERYEKQLEASEFKSKEPYYVHLKFKKKDLKTGEEEQKSIYIGKKQHPRPASEYVHLENGEKMKVLDWSSKDTNFYNYHQDQIEETGFVEINDVRYEVSEIRKFNIDNGEWISCFSILEGGKPVVGKNETDPYLQVVLNRKKEETEFSDIISTLQSSQNRIIRLPSDESFVVQGCAGCGKTAILLHRLAYLQDNGRLDSFGEIRIVTPNPEFAAYIEPVCKTLGLNSDRFIIQTTGEYYQQLAGLYNQNLTDFDNFWENYRIEYESLPEDGFSKEFIQKVYSAEFFENTSAIMDEMADRVREENSLFFEVFEGETPDHPGSVFEAIQKWNVFEKKHQKEIRHLKWKETVLTRLCAQTESKEIRRFQTQKDAIRRKLENWLQRIEQDQDTPGEKSLLASLKKDLVREHKAIEKELIKKRKDAAVLTDAPNSSDNDSEQKEKIGQLRVEITLLEKTLELLVSLTEKNKLNGSKLSTIIDLLEKQIRLLNNDGFETKLADWQDPWIFETKKLLEITRLKIAEDKKAGPKQEQHEEEIRENWKAHQEICRNLFGQDLCVSLLEKQAINASDSWNWDRIFEILIASRLPRTVQPSVSLNKIKYRFNLYLVVLAQSLYFPALKGKTVMLNIDEGQDLSAGELYLFSKVYEEPVCLNIYGDLMQNISSAKGLSDWEEITSRLELKKHELNQNYRNPVRITRFCNSQFDQTIEPVGEDIKEQNITQMISRISEASAEFIGHISRNSDQRNAVIYAREEAWEAFDHLMEQMGRPDVHFELLNVREAKGREFQNVLVLRSGMTPNEAYVSITRALKKVIICNEQFPAAQMIEPNPVQWLDFALADNWLFRLPENDDSRKREEVLETLKAKFPILEEEQPEPIQEEGLADDGISPEPTGLAWSENVLVKSLCESASDTNENAEETVQTLNLDPVESPADIQTDSLTDAEITQSVGRPEDSFIITSSQLESVIEKAVSSAVQSVHQQHQAEMMQMQKAMLSIVEAVQEFNASVFSRIEQAVSSMHTGSAASEQNLPAAQTDMHQNPNSDLHYIQQEDVHESITDQQFTTSTRKHSTCS